MASPIPKPDAERVRRNAPTFAWTDLPAAGRPDPAPSLPKAPKWLEEHGGWPVATRAAWKNLWATPQSTVWDQSGKTLFGWAALHASVELGGPVPARMSEMRQIEDRHGLNPAALLRLRWRIVAAEPEPEAKQERARPKDRRGRVLRLVADGEATKG